MESNQRPFSLSLTRTILLLLHYFLGYLFVYRILASQITVFIMPGAKYILPSVQYAMYAITMIVTILLAWPSIKHSYHKFKENFNRNIALILLLCVIGITVNIALSMLISVITNTAGSNNQQVIEESINVLPLITLLSSCVVAPIVEECVFRCGLFTFVRRKLDFISSAIISSVIFASIHFADAIFTGNISDISYVFVYTGIGIVLAYAYEKSDSVIVSGGVHFLNNALSMVRIFLL